jgi:DNA-binding beta-propeller fold protein YncE
MTNVNFGYRSRFALDSGSARLLYPARLTWTASGKFYVTDSKVDAMFIYDSEGNLTGQLRGLDKPLGIIADAQGRIYVGNNGRNNVEVYSGAGVLLRVIDNGNLNMPNDLVLDREQNLYVLDSQNKMVKVYNPSGQFLRRIGRAGGGDGHFAFPIAMAINYRIENDVEVGELFVADKQSSRIQVFDLAGNYLRTFGGPVEAQGMFVTTWIWEGKFVGVQSLAFDQHGRLHALDSYQDSVQILDPVTGGYINHYDAFLDDTGAHLQLDIDISPDGRVIMTNAATRRVEFIYTVQ